MRKRASHNKFFAFMILTIVVSTCINILTSCEKKSDYVLSKSKLTEVLYDYHIAQGLIANLPSDSAYLAKVYYDAIFLNNGITEQEFDSSMIYYNHQSDDMNDIYAELSERFREESKSMLSEKGSDEMLVLSANGDTADIWMGSKVLILRNSNLFNKQTFSLKCDTSFHRFDHFILSASNFYIRENKENSNFYITMCLSLQYKNGRVVSSLQHSNADGLFQVRLNAVDDEDLQSISGFFYYEGNSSGRNLGVVHNISLFRMHDHTEHIESTEVADSVETDSVQQNIPAILHNTEPVLTPDQKRQQSIKNNSDAEKVQIKSAPDVRTPNSYGRLRRRRL